MFTAAYIYGLKSVAPLLDNVTYHQIYQNSGKDLLVFLISLSIILAALGLNYILMFHFNRAILSSAQNQT